ncbi:hypothetical protein PHET_01260 [Paragonimus heterotremus]|uniref:CUB domain-containing protein n=1 Tax=Paragonimus heterotremus TaxID=100268 RepID=A0A8J4X370_9TREM|nr:hypothetical protein PHET_01260 [Paragonimus heterotremus]
MFDSILVLDGSSCMSPLIARFASSTRHEFTSTQNTISVLFISDFSGENTGFVANFSDARCGDVFRGDAGIIDSDNGNTYNLCFWHIQVKNGSFINIVFESLNLKRRIDWIRILNGSNCNAEEIFWRHGPSREAPEAMLIRRNDLMLISTGEYFRINYTAIPPKKQPKKNRRKKNRPSQSYEPKSKYHLVNVVQTDLAEIV